MQSMAGWLSLWHTWYCMCFLQFNRICSLGFPRFECRNLLLNVSHPSLAFLSLVSLTDDSWAMAFSECSDNWKACWLAAGTATICESEWSGECCVRGRGGWGLCESQTASRGELLTPHRCQKALRWPFAEPMLLIGKRVIILLWGKHKYTHLWIIIRNMEIHEYFKIIKRCLPVHVQTFFLKWRFITLK